MHLPEVQVRDRLPSLHKLARANAEAGLNDDRFDTSFLTLEDVAHVAYEGHKGMSSGELLKDFFEFFSEEFDWQEEIVSVREGERKTLDAPCFANLWGRARKAGLHVEDPIDAQQDIAIFADFASV